MHTSAYSDDDKMLKHERFLLRVSTEDLSQRVCDAAEDIPIDWRLPSETYHARAYFRAPLRRGGDDASLAAFRLQSGAPKRACRTNSITRAKCSARAAHRDGHLQAAR